MKNIATVLNNNSLELKNVREVTGHDDCIPFKADVYFNGKHIGYASNDGWGSDAIVNIIIKDVEIKNAWNSFCNEVNSTNWITLTSDGKDEDVKYSIGFLIDCMVFQCLVLNNNSYNWSQI